MPTKAEFDADFTRFVGELKKVDTGLAALIQNTDDAGRRLARMADSLQGRKITEQAALSAAAIEKIGGVSQVTESQLRRLAPPIREAIEIAERRGHAVPDAFRKIAEAAKGAESAITATKSSLSGLAGVGQSLLQGIGIGGGLSVFDTAVSALGGLIGQGQKLGQVSTGFQSLQGSAGQARTALEDLRSATQGLVSDADLMLAANRANLLGLDAMGVETDQLASVAIKLGRAMGLDATTAVNDFTTALGRKSTAILDNLGITLKMEEAERSYATILGKSVSALTEDEKARAFSTAAMEKARAKAAELSEQQLSLVDQGRRVVTTITDLGAAFGAGVNEGGMFAGMLGGVADAIDRIRREYEDLQRRVSQRQGKPAAGTTTWSDVVNAASSTVLAGTGAAGAIPGASGLAASVGEWLFTQTSWDRYARLPMPAAKNPAEAARAKAFAAPGALTFFSRPDGDDTKAWEAEWRRVNTALTQERDAIAKAAQAAEKARLAEEKKRRDALTGKDVIATALQGWGDMEAVGLQRLRPSQASKLFGDLVDARAVAKQNFPHLASGFGLLLDDLASHPQIAKDVRAAGTKIFAKLADPDDLKKLLTQNATVAAKDMAKAFWTPAHFARPTIGLFEDPFESTGLAGAKTWTQLMQAGVDAKGKPLGTEEFLRRNSKATSEWRSELVGVSQAFAQLAQVSGGLDPVTRQIGVFVAGLQASEQLVTSIGKSISKDFKFDSSVGGKGIAAGLAGGLMGFDLGGLFSSRTGGALAGAVGGAGAGWSVGGPVGAGIGAGLGALSGYFGAAGKASELRKLKDLQADQLVAQYGSLQELLVTVDRLGMNTTRFLDRFYGEPKAFAQGVNELTVALQREQKAAEALGTALEVVSRRQGVLSAQQARDLAGVRPGSPGEGMARAFAEQQRELAGAGLGLAGLAFTRLTATSDRELADLRHDVDRLFADVRDPEDRRSRSEQETETRLTALQADKATSVLDRFGSAAGGMAVGLSLQFQTLLDQGYSTAEALAAIREPASQLDAILARAGRDGGAAFGELRGILTIANDEALAPALDLGIGLGKVLAGLGNQGGLTGAAFTQLAGGVAESYYEMERMGQGGVNAVRALRDPLQHVWQLQQDFGYEVDESTQRLLDFAHQSGQIGDAFRPFEQKALGSFDRMVERLDTMIDLFRGDLVTGATDGATAAGRNILDAFARVRPVIPVAFEWQLPDVAATPPGAPRDPARTSGSHAGIDAVRAASGRTDLAVNIDGERVAYIVSRHLGGVFDTAGV